MAAEEVVAVLVVPVSCVSQGGFEQTRVTVPEPSLPAPASVELGCSEVGEARMDTGRSCTGWASTPLGVVIRVTCVGWFCRDKSRFIHQWRGVHKVFFSFLNIQIYSFLLQDKTQ